ncbi:hypothetical protein VT84_36705 [Gemmata sp. SH-PL17]|uniref:three-Cys-motif partner protein TcmP n=1 Tax=Gemmata sp. SH-PL17 TaxID=1630693 RepID=UPI00078ED108|nr:three-Cys-motif partner protein TcmP [Gemmata sp. SH-PL17]AMV29992.1 hypothetical protein VT84_36705 [Gemmata sp. SH-PL17]
MATNEDYVGREQSLVKHYILRHYLERFAHIIGSRWTTITYVDCFSGPWESQTADLSDTSFAIALQELRKARDTLREWDKSLAIQCFFLEEKAAAHAQLRDYANKQIDASIVTRNAALMDCIPEIIKFIQQGGRSSFPFIFIDPTGWSGYDLDCIQPLLRQSPGEVLINFMTEHIRRFVSPKESRAEIIDSFHRLFGTDEVFARISQIADPQDREDELFTTYANRIREVGAFEFVCPAVVLHPASERTFFHLIYATRHRRGVEVFKQVEKDAFFFQEEIRAGAKEAEQIRKTGQGSLFAEEEAKLPSFRAITLRERYLAAALRRVNELRVGRKQVPYDEIWDAALAFPLVWESDVKEWVAEQKRVGRINVLGLAANQRVPQWEEGHTIEFRD